MFFHRPSPSPAPIQASEPTPPAGPSHDDRRWIDLLSEAGIPLEWRSARQFDQDRYLAVETLIEERRRLQSGLPELGRFCDVVGEHLRSLTIETERAAEGILGHLGAVDSCVTEAVEFICRNDEDSQRLLALSGEQTRQNGEVIESLTGRIEARRAGVESERRHKEELVAETRALAAATAGIGGLAKQTNILALNATIEATRAGEFGKGFNVVAAEVKKLAQSSNETGERVRKGITQIMDAIQRQIEEDDSQRNLDDETGLVSEISAHLRDLTGALQRTSDLHVDLLGGIDSRSRQISGAILESIAAIQFQDIVRQQIGVLIQALDGLRDWVPGVMLGEIEPTSLIDRMRRNYVMAEQHMDLARASGEDVSVEELPAIELF